MIPSKAYQAGTVPAPAPTMCEGKRLSGFIPTKRSAPPAYAALPATGIAATSRPSRYTRMASSARKDAAMCDHVLRGSLTGDRPAAQAPRTDTLRPNSPSGPTPNEKPERPFASWLKTGHQPHGRAAGATQASTVNSSASRGACRALRTRHVVYPSNRSAVPETPGAYLKWPRIASFAPLAASTTTAPAEASSKFQRATGPGCGARAWLKPAALAARSRADRPRDRNALMIRSSSSFAAPGSP